MDFFHFFVSFSLLWLLPFSLIVCDFIIKYETEKIKMKKRINNYKKPCHAYIKKNGVVKIEND